MSDYEIDPVAYFEAWRAAPPLLDAESAPKALIPQWLYDMTSGEARTWLDGQIAEGRVIVLGPTPP